MMFLINMAFLFIFLKNSCFIYLIVLFLKSFYLLLLFSLINTVKITVKSSVEHLSYCKNYSNIYN